MMATPYGIITFIGIGSNMEAPTSSCREAIEYIGNTKGCRLLRSSSLYRTEPVGFLDQSWFVNAVIEIITSLTPRELLQELQAIETRMGRETFFKWGPRIIDLDILLYGQEVINDIDFKVPHPELHKRRFVLVPLHELAPYAIHPAFGVSAAGLMQRLEDQSRVERIFEGQGTT